jgi:hypothetical protein
MIMGLSIPVASERAEMTADPVGVPSPSLTVECPQRRLPRLSVESREAGSATALHLSAAPVVEPGKAVPVIAMNYVRTPRE